MPKPPTARQKGKVTQKILAFREHEHWSNPPGEDRDGHLTVSLSEHLRHLVDVQRLKHDLLGTEIDPLRILEALRRNEAEPFFRGLRSDPTLLAYEEIRQWTITAWFARKEDDPEAQRLLRRVGTALAYTSQGRKPVSVPQPNREAKAISAAVARLERHYHKSLAQLQDSDSALKATLTYFKDTNRMSKARMEAVRTQLKARVRSQLPQKG